MKPQCIFVTGATGYVGSRLIPCLLERDYEVRALARKESTGKLPAGCRIIEGIHWIGTPSSSGSVAPIRSSNSSVYPKPAPWKGPAFRAIDLVSTQASIEAARSAAVQHFVYVSVAHPAPVMRAYIAVRRTCEETIRTVGVPATVIRPWYILGPGHRWPLMLVPAYRIMSLFSSTREAAARLGLVTIDDMLAALVWAIEHPPEAIRIVDVPEIRRLGSVKRRS